MIHSDTEISAICQLLLDERIFQQYLNQNSSDEDTPALIHHFQHLGFQHLTKFKDTMSIQVLKQAKLDDPFRQPKYQRFVDFH